MLRITTHHNEDAIELRLAGRLGGAEIGELERCWRAMTASRAPISIVVDLTDVTFVDPTGRGLLAQIHEHGGTLRAGGVMTKAIIEKIKRRR